MSKITIDRAVAEQALEALLNEGEFRKILKPLIEKSIDSIRDALEQPHRNPTQHDIADSALLGNIESPFNACMHQGHCKRWKERSDQQHHGNHSSDNDLQSKTGNLVTGITELVPEGWKLVPKILTEEMEDAGCEAIDTYHRHDIARAWEVMLNTAPQQKNIEQQKVDQEPYLYYDPVNGDTWTPEAIDDGFRQPDGLIALYTK